MEQLLQLLPPRVIRELKESGARVELGSLDDTKRGGTYDPDQDCITLNIRADPQRIAEFYAGLAGTSVEPEAAFVVVGFHELGHRQDRERLIRISKIEGETFLQTIRLIRSLRADCEVRADEFAINKFWDWRLNIFDKADYMAWKAARL